MTCPWFIWPELSFWSLWQASFVFTSRGSKGMAWSTLLGVLMVLSKCLGDSVGADFKHLGGGRDSAFAIHRFLMQRDMLSGRRHMKIQLSPLTYKSTHDSLQRWFKQIKINYSLRKREGKHNLHTLYLIISLAKPQLTIYKNHGDWTCSKNQNKKHKTILFE